MFVTREALSFRVERGRKGPADLRLEVWNGREFVAVSMHTVFRLADFLFENEDVLYPPEHGYRGGAMFLQYVRMAAFNGYAVAEQRLDEDKNGTD